MKKIVTRCLWSLKGNNNESHPNLGDAQFFFSGRNWNGDVTTHKDTEACLILCLLSCENFVQFHILLYATKNALRTYTKLLWDLFNIIWFSEDLVGCFLQTYTKLLCDLCNIIHLMHCTFVYSLHSKLEAVWLFWLQICRIQKIMHIFCFDLLKLTNDFLLPI
jgi:hypothetical protein